MNTILLLLALIFVLFLTQVYGQRRRNRTNHRENSSFGRCHHRELEICLNKLTNLVKDEDRGSIITTSSGIDKVCRTIKEETLTCILNYFQTCGTPLHKEVSGLVIEHIEHRVDKFCNDEQQRSKLLSQTPCYHKNVFSTNEHKTKCNNKFLSAGDNINTNHLKVDTIQATLCCGYNKWHDCTVELINEKCGEKGREVYAEFSANTIGKITNMMCPLDILGPQYDTCSTVPTDATDDEHKSGSNAVTKYILNLFSFLFVNDQ